MIAIQCDKFLSHLCAASLAGVRVVPCYYSLVGVTKRYVTLQNLRWGDFSSCFVAPYNRGLIYIISYIITNYIDKISHYMFLMLLVAAGESIFL